MKTKIFSLFGFLILFASCTSMYDLEKVEFTNRLVSNPELIYKTLVDSGYICEQVKIEPEIINALRNFTYKYYVDKITYAHHSKSISKGYTILLSIDTLYQIVYKNVNEHNPKYLTFIYIVRSNKYCFDNVYWGNVFDN